MTSKQTAQIEQQKEKKVANHLYFWIIATVIALGVIFVTLGNFNIKTKNASGEKQISIEKEDKIPSPDPTK